MRGELITSEIHYVQSFSPKVCNYLTRVLRARAIDRVTLLKDIRDVHREGCLQDPRLRVWVACSVEGLLFTVSTDVRRSS
jgi:hypothetical protein